MPDPALSFELTGSKIIIHYSSSEAPAREVVAEIEQLEVKSVAVRADASAADFGTTLVQSALREFNTDTIDIIVNNAGTAAIHQGIEEVPLDAWDSMYHINVRAPFLLIQAALPYMKQGGRIINVGSVVTRLGHEWLALYGASKGALNAMSVAIAQELGPKGITINVVAPGPISTEMSMQGSPIFQKLMNNAHIKREGSPQEVAEAIRFLATPGASYITGQILPVDGGIHLP